MSKSVSLNIRGNEVLTDDHDFGNVLAEMNDRFELLFPEKILAEALSSDLFKFPAVVSSFGAESAVLLHMVAQIKPNIPVIFIDTGKLFGETLRYRDLLQHKIGLERIEIMAPKLKEIQEIDPDGTLNSTNSDLCCKLRKVDVFARATAEYDSQISGRKRFQSQGRSMMPIIEIKDGKARLNPLANYSFDAIREYMEHHDLPDHPLYKKGYYSIGCFPCTSRATNSSDGRSGRWSGSEKSECGIHL